MKALVQKSVGREGMAYSSHVLAKAVDDDRHAESWRLTLSRKLIGADVKLSDGRVVAKVVEAMRVPETMVHKGGELEPGDLLVGLLWKDKKLAALADDLDLKVSRRGVRLVGTGAE